MFNPHGPIFKEPVADNQSWITDAAENKTKNLKCDCLFKGGEENILQLRSNSSFSNAAFSSHSFLPYVHIFVDALQHSQKETQTP